MVIKARIKLPPIQPHMNNCYEMGLLNSAIQEELKASYAYEKEFHSLHESESVLREEIEEAQEEILKIGELFDKLHRALRDDDVRTYLEVLGDIRQAGWDLLREAAQVSAMSQKSIDSFIDTDEAKWRHFDGTT